MTHFDPRSAADLLSSRGRRYRSTIIVTAEPVTADETWTSSTGDTLRASAGDWWVSDGSDRWSVKSDIFDRTYTHLGAGRYRKSAPVTAAALDEPFTVATLEGDASGGPGDFLVTNPGGDVWVVPESVFIARYEQE